MPTRVGGRELQWHSALSVVAAFEDRFDRITGIFTSGLRCSISHGHAYQTSSTDQGDKDNHLATSYLDADALQSLGSLRVFPIYGLQLCLMEELTYKNAGSPHYVAGAACQDIPLA
jgi:hypothetical protein